MKLKGKAKELFEEWLFKWIVNNTEVRDSYEIKLMIKEWHLNPFSMQFGVFVDFFDSLDMEIVLFKNDDSNEYHWFISGSVYEGYEKTRQEARIKALEKSQEIINSK